ncbi:MAG: GNAT family N-acetyltransferase [Lysobacter sp.]|nr:GNAT family N-acetyltransferase [Lysobacter sp.]
MKARNRLPPWHEKRTLPNGREVLIRPIRIEDAEPLRAGFGLLRPDEIRQRFLYAIKELTPAAAERLCRPHPEREFALVVSEPMPPGEALIGAVARIAIEPNSREGEFAILVSHYISGMGLGRLLMLRLVRWAKRKRLTRLYGEVLEHNTAMLALAQSVGFRRENAHTPGLVRVVLNLDRSTADPEICGPDSSDADEAGDPNARDGTESEASGIDRNEETARPD